MDETDLTLGIRPGMVVRAADGARLGHVGAVDADGFVLANGPAVKWSEIVDVKDDEVWVSAHRYALDERHQSSPHA